MCARVAYPIRPLDDERWTAFVDRHPRSCAFHTTAWLQALQRTYGYQPVAYTTTPPGARLENSLLFCRVTSWVTGRRLISLPFSDHCEPLVDNAADEELLVSASLRSLQPDKLRYVELRLKHPLAGAHSLHLADRRYYFHELDLQPDLSTLFGRFHKSSTQRKILRAEREGLIYKAGQSDSLLDAFWDLLLITRRRHGIPPQPKNWFRNLIECFGPALEIRVAFKEKRPVAAILTLRHKDTLVYKYGCSDARFNNVGGTQLLFWKTIQEAKQVGLHMFDLGRTDCDNEGLIAFKDRWGSTRSTVIYSRIWPCAQADPERSGIRLAERITRALVPHLPDRLLRMVGRLVYRHIA